MSNWPHGSERSVRLLERIENNERSWSSLHHQVCWRIRLQVRNIMHCNQICNRWRSWKIHLKTGKDFRGRRVTIVYDDFTWSSSFARLKYRSSWPEAWKHFDRWTIEWHENSQNRRLWHFKAKLDHKANNDDLWLRFYSSLQGTWSFQNARINS